MRRVDGAPPRSRGSERRPKKPWRRLVPRALAFAGVAAGLAAAATQAPPLPRQAVSLALHDAGVSASLALGLSIDRVYALGRRSTREADLQAALAPAYGQGTLLLDTADIRARVMELPWVREATVRAMLPDLLWVELREHEAVALWFDGAKTWLVGIDGSLLPVPDTRPFAQLKLLYGEGAPAAAADLLAMLSQAPAVAARVTAAGRVGLRRWNIYLDGRVEARLPEQDALPALRRLAQLIDEGALLTRAVEAVDLRNAAFTALRLKGDPKDVLIGRGA